MNIKSKLFDLRLDIDKLDKLLCDYDYMINNDDILNKENIHKEINDCVEHIKAMSLIFCLDLNQYIIFKKMERGN